MVFNEDDRWNRIDENNINFEMVTSTNPLKKVQPKLSVIVDDIVELFEIPGIKDLYCFLRPLARESLESIQS